MRQHVSVSCARGIETLAGRNWPLVGRECGIPSPQMTFASR
jgi:hypothetical protein